MSCEVISSSLIDPAPMLEEQSGRARAEDLPDIARAQ